MTQRTFARVGLVFVLLAAGAGTASARQTGAQQLSQADRDAAVEHLQETKENFLKSIANLSDAQWKFKAAPDRWSIAEVAEHIAISESTILGLITDKIMKAPPVAKDPAGPTDEKVIAAVTDRSQKAQAPEMLKPTNRYPTREALTKEFTTARERTIDYVKTTGDDLRGHSAPHPAMKMIDAYQWVLLLSAHSARHTAQIEEVKASAGYPGT
ncbi:MAG: DinB family protein [Acidobacteria bacterium]|nr:DinB family protein [Acidobacteriota bacterium]MCA1649707.1 DinB family protein [Acidobacteriota bacterium]